MKQKKVVIAWLYPDLMSTYGDRGNIIVLTKRCQWRKIPVEVKQITLETPVSVLRSCNLIFMGGAQDRQQKIAGDDFRLNKGPVIKKMIEGGTPALFVCAAYQFVGQYYKPYQGEPIPGAGIWDLFTVHPGDQAKRCIGNTMAEVINPAELAGTVIVGFENHGGRSHLGPKMKPLGKVLKGYGNNGEDGFEGAVYKNSIGCYYHGPFLPKNPVFADWLISKVVGKLSPLDDSLEKKANEAVRSL